MKKIKSILSLSLFLTFLLYSRFVNLSWGLPYPMHPDERNMALALVRLRPENFFRPDFFAYGQFPLYLGYVLIQFNHLFSSKIGAIINFEEATISLRVISALASIINALILIKLINLIISNSQFSISDKISNFKLQITNWLIIIFAPFFIQFSHFGTTESLLMLLYSVIIYCSLLYLKGRSRSMLFLSALFSGLAIATKVSAVIFILTPLMVMLTESKDAGIFFKKYYQGLRLVVFTLLVAIIFSPYNFINFPDFLDSMKYESDVALGRYLVFYTRQFSDTHPLSFQLTKIFPFTLGWPILILSILGFAFLSWKDKRINLLRFAFLIYFLPNALIFAKWTRFIAPVMPIMLVIASLFLISIYDCRWLKTNIKIQKFLVMFCHSILWILIFASILPGLAYLSVYQNEDVRFVASDWIEKNIPENSYILSETANVIDLPVAKEKINGVSNKNYHYVSFNFYDLDENKELLEELNTHLSKADYIFVPSRRIFMNHTCLDAQNPSFNLKRFLEWKKCERLEKKYPLLYEYYQKLFSGQLGFKQVAEFSSYPKITFLGKTILEFPDETAEETWSVFDHPVIRIYKKM